MELFVGLNVPARDVVRDLPRLLADVPPGAHAEAVQRPPVHGKTPRALCAYRRDTPPTPRPATRGRRAHACGRTAIRHWLEPHRTSPTALAPMPWFL
jgi:hypothetical protein